MIHFTQILGYIDQNWCRYRNTFAQ